MFQVEDRVNAMYKKTEEGILKHTMRLGRSQDNVEWKLSRKGRQGPACVREP